MIKDTSFKRMAARDAIVEQMRKMPHFSDKRIDRVANCSSIEVKQRWKDGRIRTLYANHCHDRICPLCQKRRHQHAAAWLREVDRVERAKAEELIGKKITDQAWYQRYKFMTISPFVSSHDLTDLREKLQWLCHEVTDLNRYYFQAKVGVKPIGYFRSFEITYDKEKGFHPHIHCIYLYPERAPYVDEREVERAVFKALSKTSFLGRLSDGSVQSTVSLKITDCYKKDVHAAEFELTKYMTKVEVFDDLEKYCRLSLNWRGIPQFRASGVFKGMDLKDRYSSIVQNLHFTSTKSSDLLDSEVVAFYGSSKNRKAFVLDPIYGFCAAAYMRRQKLKQFQRQGLSVDDEIRRDSWLSSPSDNKIFAFWFDSGGLQVRELPPWNEELERQYINGVRCFSVPGFDHSRKFRIASKKLTDKLGFEQLCLFRSLS